MSALRSLSFALLLLSVTSFSVAIAQSDADTLENVYAFTVESDVELANDRMTATLVVDAEASEAAVLADDINATMTWALDQLAEYDDVRGVTRDYNTWPRYDSSKSRRLIGWQGSQTLELQSENLTAMGKVIAILQERLQIRGTALSVKPESRRAATDALIEEALEAFRQRARLIQNSFGASKYVVLDVNIRRDGSYAEPPVMRGRMLAMESASRSVAEPGIAAGTSRVQVQVSGRIRLEP